MTGCQNREMTIMASNDTGKELRQQFWGWILFVLCGVFFMASSIRSRDMLTLAGTVVFLIACVVFMVPLVRAMLANRTRD
jgi:uncharacterized membrane protein YhaH (DUF805 family)